MGITDPKDTRTMSQLLDLALFPGTREGPLVHVIAAKAGSIRRNTRRRFQGFCNQVISNGTGMAKAWYHVSPLCPDQHELTPLMR